MGRPNGAARAEVEGDKCAGSGDPIGSGNESPVPGWKPHGSGRTESLRWLGFRGPRSGSSHGRTAVTSSGSSFVGISARPSAVGLGVFTIPKKKRKEQERKAFLQFCKLKHRMQRTPAKYQNRRQLKEINYRTPLSLGMTLCCKENENRLASCLSCR